MKMTRMQTLIGVSIVVLVAAAVVFILIGGDNGSPITISESTVHFHKPNGPSQITPTSVTFDETGYAPTMVILKPCKPGDSKCSVPITTGWTATLYDASQPIDTLQEVNGRVTVTVVSGSALVAEPEGTTTGKGDGVKQDGADLYRASINGKVLFCADGSSPCRMVVAYCPSTMLPVDDDGYKCK